MDELIYRCTLQEKMLSIYDYKDVLVEDFFEETFVNFIIESIIDYFIIIKKKEKRQVMDKYIGNDRLINYITNIMNYCLYYDTFTDGLKQSVKIYNYDEEVNGIVKYITKEFLYYTKLFQKKEYCSELSPPKLKRKNAEDYGSIWKYIE